MFVGTNSLGDVNALYNANGDLIVKYEYDAWGKVLAETDANGNALTGVAATWSQLNPFRYRGYYYDVETGLYYLQSRYYDPEVGRFVNSDAIANTADSLGFNTYAYCGNNPVNFDDPSGFFLKKVGNGLKKLWNRAVSWAQETFGFSSSAKTTIVEVDFSTNYPISITKGSRIVETREIVKSNRPTNVYFDYETTDPLGGSSIGVRSSYKNTTMDIECKYDNISISSSYTYDASVYSLKINAQPNKMIVGIEGCYSVNGYDEYIRVDFKVFDIALWYCGSTYSRAYSYGSNSVPAPTQFRLPVKLFSY